MSRRRLFALAAGAPLAVTIAAKPTVAAANVAIGYGALTSDAIGVGSVATLETKWRASSPGPYVRLFGEIVDCNLEHLCNKGRA